MMIDNKPNYFAGKSVKLLRDIKEISVNSETGELFDKAGDVLKFGYDYILFDGEQKDNAVRIYGMDNLLLTEFYIG